MSAYDEWLATDPAEEEEERSNRKARRDSDDSHYGDEDYE